MRRRYLLTTLGCHAALTLAGCGTMSAPPPKATRDFSAEEFFRSEPRMLRAATLSDQRVSFQSVDLDVLARSPDSQQARYIIRLQRSMPTDARMLDAPAGQRWQVFMLDENGVAVYETVRNLLATLPRGRGYSVDVNVDVTPGLTPTGLPAQVPLRIDMMTDPRSGWFTLRDSTFDPAADLRAPANSQTRSAKESQ